MIPVLTISLLLALILGLILYLVFVPRNSGGYVTESKESESAIIKAANILGEEIYSALPEGSYGNKRSSNPRIKEIIRQSGNPWGINEQEFIFLTVFAFAAGFSLGWLAWWILMFTIPMPWWVVVPVVTGIVGSIPYIKYKDLAKNRDLTFKKELPKALDLIVISLAGGRTFTGALKESLPNMDPSILKDEFSRLLSSVEMGKPLNEALTEFKERSPNEGVRVFVQAVQEATILDVPLIDVMKSRAAASRQELFSLIHNKVATMPTKLMGVLTPTLSGALMLILMGPSLLMLMTIFE